MQLPDSRFLSRAALSSALACLATISIDAGAFPGTGNDWNNRYGAQSTSGESARCQLCHVNDNGGDPWNGYGWDIRDALADNGCDLDGSGDVSNEEAFFCVELDNSDNDGSGYDNITETGLNTQPGWTNGANNTWYFKSGLTTTGELPPEGIGNIDPDGTEPPPPEPPMPPQGDADVPPGQKRRPTIVVRPGDSIQRAIDIARPGTRIFVLAGTYREQSDPTNGLVITKNGISLIGQTTKKKRVVLENAGNQRNGIVVVPEDRADCMSCHTDLAPPFPTHPGVPPGLKMREPMMSGFEIRGFTIKGFDNNGLFTENVDGFQIVDVISQDNRNYGIFPTLSKNGLISHSKSIGSDKDSGIWIETSENVVLRHSQVSGNVNGIEVSNSDDIVVAHNEAYGNTVGAAILLLPDIFDDRPGAKRIDLRNNWFHDNNKPNTARPGSILSFVPSGTGVLYLGVDDSVIEYNQIENNNFSGIAIADYCVTVSGGPYDCSVDPDISLKFLADQAATGNVVRNNTLVGNGTDPGGHPFGFAAADLTLLTLNDTNCYEGNLAATYFSLIGIFPPCD